MFDKWRRCMLSAACRQIAVAGLLATAWTNGAAATQACQGSYAATLLQPLPKQIIVDLDVRDRSPRNLKLAERFLAGVRDAGVAVGAQPTVLLHISSSSLNAGSARSDRGVERNYSELTALQGGQQPALPTLPTNRLANHRAPAAAPPLLFLRVDATEGKEPHISWIASVQCQMTGSDQGQVAEDLGRVIGGALGQRIERQPF